MPISRSASRQRPSDSLQRQAGLYRRILRYIDGIIVIDEIVANSAAEDEQRSKKQRGTDRDRAGIPVLGWGRTGMMPLSCNRLEAPWPHRQDARVTLVSHR